MIRILPLQVALGLSTEEVSDAIGNLKPNKAVGSDQIPSNLLKAWFASLVGP